MLSKKVNTCSYFSLWLFLGKTGNCPDFDCPLHGQGTRERACNKAINKVIKIGPEVGSRQWIFSLESVPSPLEQKALIDECIKIARQFDRSCKVDFNFHLLPSNPHFNFGVFSSRFMRLKAPRGFYQRAGRHLKDNFIEFIDAMMSIELPFIVKIKEGYAKFKDNPEGWLKYIWRVFECLKFYNPNEKIIRGRRRKQAVKKVNDNFLKVNSCQISPKERSETLKVGGNQGFFLKKGQAATSGLNFLRKETGWHSYAGDIYAARSKNQGDKKLSGVNIRGRCYNLPLKLPLHPLKYIENIDSS